MRVRFEPFGPALATLIEGQPRLGFYDDALPAPGPGWLPVPGGEGCKNDRQIYDSICLAIDQARICRHSYVIAMGGGAVLDVVGFAAATVHRGVRLIRIPTTTLSQADSALGVKNGINAFGKKNLLGTYTPPWAVLIDHHLLHTLPDRHWRAGFSEVVKVALLKDPQLFATLESQAAAIRQRQPEISRQVIRRSAELHLHHIRQDPWERGSHRPLDLGHWAAHRLEVLSDFELTHGEAVSLGLAQDLAYGVRIGLTPPAVLARTLQLLEGLGLPTHHPLLRSPRLAEGLQHFREHLGGQLCLSLIAEVGQEITVDRVEPDLLLA